MEITLVEIYEILQTISSFVDDSADTAQLTTLFDGELGNSDIEQLLLEINNSLTYDGVLDDENTSALSEISQRLEVIDTRIDKGFIAITDGLSLIFTCFTLFVGFKFVNWIMQPFVT